MLRLNSSLQVGVVGIGYIGLPLSIEIAKHFKVVAFDKSKKRIVDLKKNIDSTNEIKSEILTKQKINFTNRIEELKNCKIYIIAVPTPVSRKKPNLDMTISASIIIANNLKKGDVVIYESTFYPGVTEEVCVKVLEDKSKLKLNKDFYVGYSPERINPGDTKRTIDKIKKITSGSNKTSAEFIDKFYNKFIKAGTYKAKSIKVAEAAKVIENTQRDINIALINEFSMIFNKMKIDTHEILEAASTKWNFLNFKPGLVGGHCIGVDPYYLTYKAKKIGYNPKLILAGRKINDNYYKHLGNIIFKSFNKKKKIKVLICGFTFKENCNDIRNTKIFNLFNFLKKNNNDVDIYDKLADKDEVKSLYKIELINKIEKKYDLVILAVKHNYLIKKNITFFKKILNKNGKIFDIKKLFPKDSTSINL